jgi:transposase
MTVEQQFHVLQRRYLNNAKVYLMRDEITIYYFIMVVAFGLFIVAPEGHFFL